MQLAGYKTLEQKPYDSYYLYVEATIDHPVETIWRHALNIGSWMTAHRLKTISGERGEVGHFEIVFPRNLGSETPPPHHHFYGIANVIPYKYIGLEVFPEKGGSYGKTHPWISFDAILFVDMGGRTRVIFLMIHAHPEKGDAESDRRQKEEISQAGDVIKGYFENLRRLAAGE